VIHIADDPTKAISLLKSCGVLSGEGDCTSINHLVLEQYGEDDVKDCGSCFD